MTMFPRCPIKFTHSQLIRLINTPTFRTLLVASCMLASDTPAVIPKHGTPPSHDDVASANSMSVSGEPRTTKRKSAKPKRRYSRSIVDSGATVHCIKDRSLFTHLDTSKHVKLRVADNRTIVSEGVGTCAISLRSSDGELHTLVLHNCIYSPQFSET